MRKIIITNFYFICLNTVYCQDEQNNLQINIINQTKDAFISRKTFLINKNPFNYDDSFKKFIIADSLVSNFKMDNSDKIDQNFYDIISKSINKELNTSKEDITKLTKGTKTFTKTDDGNYEFTDGERTYYTFLVIVLYKIEDKIKELTSNK